MANINSITGINGIIGNKPVSKNGQDGFQKTLEKAFASQKALNTAGTEKSTLEEIRPTVLNEVKNSPGTLEEKADRLLNNLDIYAKALANPYVSLKEVSPVVISMKNDADDIIENMKKQGNHNDKLKEIATESAMLANIEYIKFTRGDYV